MTAPAWVQRVRGETFRAVQLRQCSRCRAAILVGLDHDVAAGTAKVDPAPLNELGEAHARINGRNTYTVNGDKHRKQLDYRQDWHIRDGTKGKHVVAQHSCGWIAPLEHIQFPPPLKQRQEYDEPPF